MFAAATHEAARAFRLIGPMSADSGLQGKAQIFYVSHAENLVPRATNRSRGHVPISAVKIAPERPKEPTMKVLMVLTSHDQLGDTGRKTGFWLEELAAPYYVFKDARAQITLASPKGGRPPLDPKSQDPSFQTDITRRFEKDADAEGQLDKTVRLESVEQEDYDTVFYPGGHGPMWDLAEDPNSVKLIEAFLAAGNDV